MPSIPGQRSATATESSPSFKLGGSNSTQGHRGLSGPVLRPNVVADLKSAETPFGPHGLAYNLGNLWRRLGLPQRIKSWSLTSLQHRLIKTGGRLLKHARYYWLLLAEGHLNRKLFGEMLGRIWALPVPGG